METGHDPTNVARLAQTARIAPIIALTGEDGSRTTRKPDAQDPVHRQLVTSRVPESIMTPFELRCMEKRRELEMRLERVHRRVCPTHGLALADRPIPSSSVNRAAASQMMLYLSARKRLGL